ncbi:gamete and mating-type specific protein A-like [Biomphalaria glabrata]|uniref:Gamete and mating-type specific protein A-like n=1 Tax=Biomphalaria glabrata TaxID=6526 RepID=A0A9U8EHG9_BIOGL|nr:gamete and mating-type specific protein A-like [Biomphalaria glabrata]KAI8772208.1 hypothetical protein BgiBS90_026688 [Biomphalaria glabrata]
MHYLTSQLLTCISYAMILLLGRFSETNSSATPTARFNDSMNILIEKKTPQTNTSAPQTNNPAPQANTLTPQTNTPTPQTNTPAPQTNTPTPQTNTPTPQTNTPAAQTNTPTPITSDLEPAEDPEVIQWLEVMSWSSDECKQAVRERYATTEFSELNCGSIYLFNIHAADYFNCAEDEKCQMLKHFCKKSPEAQDLLIRNEIQKCSGKPQSKS